MNRSTTNAAGQHAIGAIGRVQKAPPMRVIKDTASLDNAPAIAQSNALVAQSGDSA
jgi:hypothetical protein